MDCHCMSYSCAFIFIDRDEQVKYLHTAVYVNILEIINFKQFSYGKSLFLSRHK